jgi:hypothetical protein
LGVELVAAVALAMLREAVAVFQTMKAVGKRKLARVPCRQERRGLCWKGKWKSVTMFGAASRLVIEGGVGCWFKWCGMVQCKWSSVVGKWGGSGFVPLFYLKYLSPSTPSVTITTLF